MNRQEIEKKVNDILVDKLGVDYSEINANAKMKEDLKADSLDTVELSIEFEKEFSIVIPDDKMYAMNECTVGDIYNYIDEAVNE